MTTTGLFVQAARSISIASSEWRPAGHAGGAEGFNAGIFTAAFVRRPHGIVGASHGV